MATSNGFLGCSGGREGGGNKEAGKPRAGSVSDRRERQGWMLLLLLEMRRRLAEGKCKYSTYRMLRL